MQKNYCKNWNTKKTICFDSKTQSMLFNHDIEVRSNINCWKTVEANRIKNPATKKLKMNRPKRGRDLIKKGEITLYHPKLYIILHFAP